MLIFYDIIVMNYSPKNLVLLTNMQAFVFFATVIK